MKTIVISGKYPRLICELKAFMPDANIVLTHPIVTLPSPEQLHADMQILPVGDKVFILKESVKFSDNINIPKSKIIYCKNEAGKRYPENILLNFLYFGEKMYGKASAADKNLKSYCNEQGIEIINVNQGYARCSTLVVGEKAAVTADLGIKTALEMNGAEVLLVKPGNITLDGYNYGFIGGAGGLIDAKTLVIFGNIEAHPDYDKIRKFCFEHGVNIKVLCKNMPLTDIGGMVKV